VIRRLARQLIGAAFIDSGVAALRGIDQRATRTESNGTPEPLSATRAVAGTQIASGILLALNRVPRLASLVLALSVVPDAVTTHDFWTEKDGDSQRAKRSLFGRDVGLLGGLLVAAIETGGRESVPHRAVRTSKHAARAAAEHVPVG
jgi:uncharacterized membrane protein YphA (DoxX/SURF4 family)